MGNNHEVFKQVNMIKPAFKKTFLAEVRRIDRSDQSCVRLKVGRPIKCTDKKMIGCEQNVVT